MILIRMSCTDDDNENDSPIRKTLERSHDWIVERDRLIALWARASSWTLEEGISLAFNADPDRSIVRNRTSYGQDSVRVPKPGPHFLGLARRASRDGGIARYPSPAEFIAWAARVGLSFDEAWHKATATQRPDIGVTSPKDLAMSAPEEVDAEGSDAAIDETGDRDKDLNPKARTSLLKLVIGMAAGGYGFDPTDARSEITKDIADDLERQGVPLKRDTILKWLREGAELLPQVPPDQDDQ